MSIITIVVSVGADGGQSGIFTGLSILISMTLNNAVATHSSYYNTAIILHCGCTTRRLEK